MPAFDAAGRLLAILPGWWLFHHVETGFMPEMDEGAFVLDYEMPVGTSLAETDRVLRRVEACCRRRPILPDTSAARGQNSGSSRPNPLRATSSSV